MLDPPFTSRTIHHVRQQFIATTDPLTMSLSSAGQRVHIIHFNAIKMQYATH